MIGQGSDGGGEDDYAGPEQKEGQQETKKKRAAGRAREWQTRCMGHQGSKGFGGGRVGAWRAEASRSTTADPRAEEEGCPACVALSLYYLIYME